MAVVFVLMARRRAVVRVEIVMMVAVWVVMVVVIVVAVIVVVVARQTISPATLASHRRTAAISDRCVASLGHVVGVGPSAWGELPRPDGGGRRGGRS